MITFDLDKLQDKFQNKFYLVLGIVTRVKALKRGLQPAIERRSNDLITVGIEELESDRMLQDSAPIPWRQQELEYLQKALGIKGHGLI